MKKLKLNFQKLNAEVLTRSQLKQILGGDGGSGGTCGSPWWLCCTTPNGNENWCRSSNSGDATAECQAIYPAYGGAVYGNWAPNINV